MRRFILLHIFISLFALTAYSQCGVTVNFTDSTSGCRTIKFKDSTYSTSGYTPVYWKWYFGDGDTATGPTASHYYNDTISGANLDVKLVVTSQDSYGNYCTDSITKPVPLKSIPTVNIFSDPNSPGCLSDTIQFYGVSNQGISSWSWDFGDAVSSSVQNPLHHFADTGTFNVSLFITDSSGCSNQVTSPFKVVNPTVNFSVSYNPASTLDTLQFSGSSSVNVLSWSWDFADGATSSVQNPIHTFSSNGDYAVTLSALTENLCTPTVTHTVSIQSLPLADFTFSGQCLGNPTTFTDASTSPSGIKKWIWKFGDGDSTVLRVSDVNVTHPVVTHTYASSGTYPVTLTVINAYGNERSKTKDVVIDARPQANFSITQACLRDTTFFQDQTVGTVSSWKWSFGDGHTSIAQDTANKYVTPGSYSVKLVVTNTDGCSDSIVKNVVIDSLPTVQISMAKNKLCFGEQEQFYGNSQDTVTWHWDFGNGDTSAYQNPLPYTYPGIGTYRVTLKVTDINGCYSSASDTVVVMDHPQADFSFSSQRCENDSISFVDKTTSKFGILTSFNWSFWDPTSTANNSSQQNPKHYFSGGAGSYKVQLLATNSYGCQDSTYKYIKIYDTPKPGFTYIQSNNPMTTVAFTDTTKTGINHAPISSYLWTFYQSDTSHLQNPGYDFPVYDSCYPVQLTVTDTNGCSNTDTSDVCLIPPPPVDFTMSSDTICLGEQITFTGVASNIAKWHWDFGNGDTSNYQSQVYQYPAAGTYTVILSVKDVNGYSNSVSHKVFVSGRPNVNFSYGPQACKTDTISFQDKTTSPSGILTSFNWDFGDASSLANQSALQNPKHYFSGGAGSYKVKLRATNSYGCTDSTNKYVKVYDTPKPGFTYIQSNNPMTTVAFTDTSKTSVNHAPISTYLWTFYQNDTSHLQNPAYDFPTYDSCYPVQLTVTDTNGCSNTDTSDVCLVPPPTVDFTMSSDTICLGEQITFTGVATNIAKWHWDYGNGDTANYQSQIYQYPAAGTYTVTLSVTDVNGYSNSVIHKVFVVSNPLANFSYGPQTCKTDTVSFLDKSTSASGILTSFNWNFGDASSSANQSTLQNPKHYFSGGVGSYKVQLRATNSFGCTDSTYKYVKVYDTPKAGFTYIQQNSPMTTVAFTDTSTTSINHAPISAYLWTFYQNDTSHLQNPAYDFPAYDSCYPVQLTVTDTNGCSNTDTSDVCLVPPPTVDFTMSSDSICLGENITFTGQAASIAKWHWDFGNGDTSNYQNQIYKYPASGTYTVTLSVTNINGYTNSVTHKVFVSGNPKVDFVYGNACQTDSVYFSDRTVNSSGIITSYNWNFGDTASVANQSTQQNPSHYFAGGAAYYHVKLYATNTYGCSDTLFRNVKVHENPNAGFIAAQQCNPKTLVNFTDTSRLSPDGAPISTYSWHFFHGDTSNLKNPTYNFPAYDSCYSVVLTVTDTNGCMNTDTAKVCLLPPTTVDFTTSADTVCLRDNISFYGQADSISAWHWDFGNNATSLYQNPVYQYPAAGSDTVTLTVTDFRGCNTSATHVVQINPLPNTNFGFDIYCHNDTTCFHDSTTMAVGFALQSWHWDFGDGGTSNIQNPDHYYVPVQNYSASLSVTSNAGCTNTVTRLVIFDSIPHSDFTVSNPCMFDATVFHVATQTPGSSTVNWMKWDFGDGDTLISTNNPVNHIYKDTGVYVVSLIVGNSFGKYDTIVKNVDIFHKPLAAFKVNDTCFHEPYTFTDQSTADGGSALSSWNWNFGDPISGTGNASTLQNPTHAMNFSGSYDVRLIVTNADGCTDSAVHQVVVDSLPVSDFTVSKDSICLGESITFNGQASPVNSWHWDFGNGDSSALQNPEYLYTTKGDYPVQLSVADTRGCTSIKEDTVHVYGNPQAAFTFSGKRCETDSIAFTDKSTAVSGYMAGWSWNFEDTASAANTSAKWNPKHYFTGGPNTYQVRLISMNSYGCSDTVTQNVKIYDNPHAAFNYEQQCDPRTVVNFTDSSYQGTNRSPVVSYMWRFGHGDTSMQKNPTYDFPVYDSCYQVSLQVADTNGCVNSDTASVCLLPPPPVDFTMSSDSICLGEKISFSGQATDITTWHWNFGNGDTSDYQNQIYQYTSPGTYTVTLSITSLNGCANTVTHKVFVSDNPHVDFSHGLQTCMTDSIGFLDKSTTASGGLSSFSWDFGDVKSTANQSSLQNPSHYFSGGAGSYKVRLLVTNSYGCTDSTYKYVKVYDLPKPGFSYVQSNNPMTTVAFTDTSQQSKDQAPISNYLWTFYNGDMSDSVNPSYNFPDYGRSYPVTLMVTDTNGCSNTDTVDVALLPPPPVDFTMSKDTICLGEQITFSGQATNIATWHWDFGDGDTSIYQDQVYQFPSAGTYTVTLSVTDANGFSNTVTHKVFVSSNPKTDFTYGRACQTDAVSFYDRTTTTSGIITSFNWSFGDTGSASNLSTQQNPAHYFSGGAGSYHVRLYATNTYGCTDTIYQYVKVHDTPKAGFSYIQSVNPMTTVAFTDTSQQSKDRAPISNYLWTFYNGDVSDSVNPSYNFPDYGRSYPVTLMVTDTNGCSNTDTVDVALLPPPPVDFTMSKDTICLGEQITFRGQATNIATWHWNFGDGDTSIYQDQVYQYPSAGTYTVTLSVTDANGFSNTITHKVFVSSNPVVDFAYGRACQTDSVSFYDKTTTTSGIVTSYNWDFGDIASSANQSALQNPSHYFSGGTGSYHVRLYATNTYGCTDTTYKYVKVHDTPKAGFSYIQSVNPMTTVKFTDTSQQSKDRAPISNYLWKFYNGDVSDSVNPSYNFPDYGQSYPVTLTVTDTNSCSNTDTVDVNLLPPPPVDFTMSKDTICLGEQITFSGQATSITSWHWDFGDGDTSIYLDQVHQYLVAGTYTDTLSVTDANGFSNTVTHKVFVSDNPQVDFTYGRACQTDSVYFSDLTVSPTSIIVTRNWNFDDAASASNQSTQQNPAHYFSGGAGSYHVRLYATNTFGCTDTTYKYVKVHDAPKAGFTYVQQSNPITTVDFTDTSQMSRERAPINSYLWSFYHGDVSNSVNPSYNFPDYGQSYPVTLMVTDTNGCSNTDTMDVHLLPPPPVDFTMSDDTICLGEQITFNGQATNITSWHWDFGDGDTSIYQDQVYQYPSAGTYTVTLSVTDANGFINKVSHQVFVSSNPKVDFTYGRACQTDAVSFYDRTTTNSGIITSHDWTFNDTASASNQSSQQNPSHYFSGGAGSYHVRLFATNTYGCTDTIYKYVKVHDTPKAGFTYVQKINPQTKVVFTDTSQMSRDRSPISSYLWSFYNGDVSDSVNPSYNFPDYGKCYPVTLTVTDTNGCTNTDTTDVCLLPPPPVDFSMSSDTICLGEKITFSGQATNITSWHWDFGNEDSSIYQDQIYQYPSAGTYTVTLSVTDANGYSSTVKHTVFVSSNPEVDFIYSRACQTDSVYFSDRTVSPTSTIVSRSWDFGDVASPENQSALQNPSHYFSGGAGSYHVKLYATNTYGCTDTIYKYVKVYDTPKAGFSYVQSINPITTVAFTDTSQQSKDRAPISNYLWKFYNGDVSDSVNPGYNFPDYGQSYPVTLTVTDTNGCSNMDTVNVHLLPPPPVDFTMSDDTICLGEQIAFSGQATNITSWHWDFGNGDTSTYQNLTYQYSTAGAYTVTLSVTDMNGFKNIVKHKVFVSGNPKTDFTIGRACQTDAVSFYDRTTTTSGIITSFNWTFGDTASVSDQSTQQNPEHYFSNGAGSYHVRLYATNTYGCTDTTYKYVKVHDTPKAGFTYVQQSDPMTKVDFTNTSQMGHDGSPISSYLWSFYNGDVSDSINPSYNFPGYGQCYPVTLTVTDTNGCSNTDTSDVCLLPPPELNFTTTRECFGNTTDFEASFEPSSDTATGYYYLWDFGDGSTQVFTFYDTITHHYENPGTYHVELTVLGPRSFNISVSHQAIVDSLPKADFTYVTPSCDQATSFEAPTWGGGSPIKTWEWNFGDTISGAADTSSFWHPSHMYIPDDSTYYVSLKLINANGCSDSVTKPVVRSSCTHVFYTAAQARCTNNPVYFIDGTSMSSSMGKINQWEWDFGDGTTKTYTAHKDSVVHVYSSAGSYKVTVTIHSTVNNMPATSSYDSVIIVNQSPQANFGYSPACMGQTVNFTDSTWATDAGLVHWQWTFSDPSSTDKQSDAQDPQHKYSTAGSYAAQLVVTDYNNCRDTAVKNVEVHVPPIASFKITSDYEGELGQLLFSNSSMGAVSYLWEFGDGHTSTEESPVYSYESGGKFNVLLIATNEFQCSDTAMRQYDLTSGLYVPNSFVPGSDNPKLSTFTPVGINLKVYKIQIFSPWGDLLWQSTKLNSEGAPAEGWDGTFNGQPMPSGHYIWRIKAEFQDNTMWKGSDNGDGNKKDYGMLFLVR